MSERGQWFGSGCRKEVGGLIHGVGKRLVILIPGVGKRLVV